METPVEEQRLEREGQQRAEKSVLRLSSLEQERQRETGDGGEGSVRTRWTLLWREAAKSPAFEFPTMGHDDDVSMSDHSTSGEDSGGGGGWKTVNNGKKGGKGGGKKKSNFKSAKNGEKSGSEESSDDSIVGAASYGQEEPTKTSKKRNKETRNQKEAECVPIDVTDKSMQADKSQQPSSDDARAKGRAEMMTKHVDDTSEEGENAPEMAAASAETTSSPVAKEAANRNVGSRSEINAGDKTIPDNRETSKKTQTSGGSNPHSEPPTLRKVQERATANKEAQKTRTVTARGGSTQQHIDTNSNQRPPPSPSRRPQQQRRAASLEGKTHGVAKRDFRSVLVGRAETHEPDADSSMSCLNVKIYGQNVVAHSSIDAVIRKGLTSMGLAGAWYMVNQTNSLKTINAWNIVLGATVVERIMQGKQQILTKTQRNMANGQPTQVEIKWWRPTEQQGQIGVAVLNTTSTFSHERSYSDIKAEAIQKAEPFLGPFCDAENATLTSTCLILPLKKRLPQEMIDQMKSSSNGLLELDTGSNGKLSIGMTIRGRANKFLAVKPDQIDAALRDQAQQLEPPSRAGLQSPPVTQNALISTATVTSLQDRGAASERQHQPNPAGKSTTGNSMGSQKTLNLTGAPSSLWVQQQQTIRQLIQGDMLPAAISSEFPPIPTAARLPTTGAEADPKPDRQSSKAAGAATNPTKDKGQRTDKSAAVRKTAPTALETRPKPAAPWTPTVTAHQDQSAPQGTSEAREPAAGGPDPAERPRNESRVDREVGLSPAPADTPRIDRTATSAAHSTTEPPTSGRPPRTSGQHRLASSEERVVTRRSSASAKADSELKKRERANSVGQTPELDPTAKTRADGAAKHQDKRLATRDHQETTTVQPYSEHSSDSASASEDDEPTPAQQPLEHDVTVADSVAAMQHHE